MQNKTEETCIFNYNSIAAGSFTGQELGWSSDADRVKQIDPELSVQE